MTSPPQGRFSFGRRRLLIAGVLGALAAPVLAACTSEPPAEPEPDVLEPLLASARADAALAEAVAAAHPGLTAVALVASDRAEHAEALAEEIDRANPPATGGEEQPATSSAAPPPPPEPPGDPEAARQELLAALDASREQASALVATVPGFRVGLVAAVAASCTTLHDVL
ncbi:hypothetical protein C1701_19710 [Actinoalloteichus sp. AHMU CJ021]|uniref:DUF4439 family protein n=1 Tax=Actinoalloteichus caeruleus DSM 43889 TaxID=1120930 RepID=A0ABT1JPG7_ACTCY|nr:hypothetical protein [Actinoalloteichus caeruleus]AUS80190.1 hypothetical protein C1701_19710 [Actinoalloteichus sp. AHMU CJ021]MCP2334418.1 hypothetical protein [Actinoalloteichus caeruleus DSM 43889]